MTPPLGIIEGHFGRPYSWPDRTQLMRTAAAAGYGFYHYAPKRDAFLRRQWRTPHPAAERDALARFSEACRGQGVRFGIALTPMGTPAPLDRIAREDLLRRVGDLDAIGIDDLVILFDDLRGDTPMLAARQAEIVALCAATTRAGALYFCPTYYSHDPVLDRVFGQRPPGYLEDLGRRLDPAVRIYWTGPEVVSPEIGPAHLRAVAAVLERKVCLWDNYPANDGPRMSRFLHLRGFTGRPAAIGVELCGHAINPAQQPHLSALPALTLAENYARGGDYDYETAFRQAATRLFGAPFAKMLADDLAALQDAGLERLGARHAELRARYVAIDAPAAREVVAWLDGRYLMSDEEIRTQ